MGELPRLGNVPAQIHACAIRHDRHGEPATALQVPVSVPLVKRGGMVETCAGTTGHNLTINGRFLWMHQKRVQDSHFANLKPASAANRMMIGRRLDPCLS